MVIIHKERVAIPVPEMEPGTVFFDGRGRLMMATDDKDDVDNWVLCVDLGNGNMSHYDDGDVAIPQKITTVEVE